MTTAINRQLKDDDRHHRTPTFPALGIAGGGFAILGTTAVTAGMLAWYVLSGRCIVQLRISRLQWPLFREILRVGAVGTVSTL
jgi:MATE family, multidrug efflux pump